MRRKFILFGAGGYVAPKHFKAIKDTNNDLVASYDVNDSVGILDTYFPNSKFFTNESKIIKYVEECNLNYKTKIDYMVICTPNYLHESQIRLGLRMNLNVICEKPLSLNPENMKLIKKIENKTKKKCSPILQLRLHPKIKILKKQIKKNNNIELIYITPRGQWYHQSWKGKDEKSGGIETNIGIHFFDMLIWIFGDCQSIKILYRDSKKSFGVLKLKKATVKWYLSIDKKDLDKISKNKKSFRKLIANGKDVDFTEGFDQLHTESYNKIIKNKGFNVSNAFKAVELVHKIRNSNQKGSIKNIKNFITKFK